MEKMLISEIARRAEVTLRTVRYYQKLGLLGEVLQEENGYHHYDELALERLKKINQLKHLGLTLDEIQSVLDIYFVSMIEGKKRTLEILQHHLSETEKKMDNLAHFKTELHKNIEKVQSLIQEAEQGEIKQH